MALLSELDEEPLELELLEELESFFRQRCRSAGAFLLRGAAAGAAGSAASRAASGTDGADLRLRRRVTG